MVNKNVKSLSANPAFFAPPVAGSVKPMPEESKNKVRSYLAGHRFPSGLIETFFSCIHKVPLRYVICDNSGSMAMTDVSRLCGANDPRTAKMQTCSRWKELQEMLTFQSELSELSQSQVEFRFLNDFEPILMGVEGTGPDAKAMMQRAFENGPAGGTPLCKHVNEIAAEIRTQAPHLRANGQLAVLVIATDGESSDGNVAQALSQLKDLPCWVIIRLCTADEAISNYWDSVDSQLEVRMDIISDYLDEGAQIQAANPWLTYGMPLHRMREFGMILKEFDMLDEALLSVDEMHFLAKAILGKGVGNETPIPDPSHDWNAFFTALRAANNREPSAWCPVSKRERNWVHSSTVSSKYRSGGCCTIA